MPELDLERNGRYFLRMPDGSERLVRYLGEGRTMLGGEPVEPDPMAGRAFVQEIPPFPRVWDAEPDELRTATPTEIAEYRAAATIAYPKSQSVPQGG